MSLETISPLSTVHYFFDIECGLTWDPYPRAVCYNVYRADDGSTTFLGIVECGEHQCLEVDPGCYAVTAITPDGETPFGQPICTETHVPPCSGAIDYTITETISGFVLSWTGFPGAKCYNVYKNDVLIESCIPLQTISLTQTTVEQCFVVTAIAACGETLKGTPVCLPPTPPPPPIPPDDTLWECMAAYWKMDEVTDGSDRTDATGNGWTAVNSVGTVFAGPGLINGGITQPELTPPSSLVVAGAIDARTAFEPFSVQIWWRYDGADHSGDTLIGKWLVLSGDWKIYYDVPTNAFVFRSTDGAGIPSADVANTSTPIVAGNWYHIVATFDGTDLALYVNNSVVTAPLAGVRRVNGDLVIMNNQVGSEFPGGSLDEAAYWLRQLQPAEVTQLYNSGVGATFTPFTPSTIWPVVTSYWTMNEAAGQTREDLKSLNPLVDKFGNFVASPGILNDSAGPPGIFDSSLLAAAASPSLSPGPGKSFSFGGWVAFDAGIGAASAAPLWGKTTGFYFNPDFSGAEYALIWGATGDWTIRFVVYDAVPNQFPVDTAIPLAWRADGLFHFVACGYDACTGQIWIQLEDQNRVVANAPGASPTNNPLTIGTNSRNNGLTSQCRVDELVYFNGLSLTPGQVVMLTNGGAPIPPPYT